MIDILEYVGANGSSPFGRWRADLDEITRVRITLAIAKLAERNFADSKSVGGGVSELRLHFGPGYRIYFGRHGTRIVILLGGGTKKRQPSDIQQGQSRMVGL